jgi:AbrB family looped-hinge helix DNA binding protein
MGEPACQESGIPGTVPSTCQKKGVGGVATQRVRLGENGRISIPAAYRRELGMRPGDELIMHVEDGEIRLVSPKQALERARRVIAKYVKSGESLADSLIADRRAEAKRE